MRFNVLCRTIDDLERGLVTRLVIVAPRRHPMMPKDHAFGLWIVPDELFDHQPDIETRTLPRHIQNVIAIDLFRQPLLID